jgi:hypothetical protein
LVKKYNIDIIDTRGGHNKLNIPSKTELEKILFSRPKNYG